MARFFPDRLKPGAKGPVPPWLFPVALAVVLRAWNLDSQSVWYDDYNCAGYLGCERFADYLAIIRQQNPEAVPLYYVLVYGWARLLGSAGIVARWFSVALHGMAAWTLFRAGKALSGVRVGLIAALWFACSPWQVWHGQSIRPYPLVTLLACLVLWGLIARIQGGHREVLPGICAVASLIVLPWTHLTTLVMLPAIAIGWVAATGIAAKPRIREVLIVSAIAVVCWLPLVYWVLHLPMVSELAYSMYHPPDALRSLFAVLAPDAPQRMGEVLAGFPERWNQWLPQMVLIRDCLEWLLAVTGFAAILVTGVLVYRKTTRHGTPEACAALRMVWIMAVLPPVLLILLSYGWRPCFMPRYLSASVPALYLLIGVTLAVVPRRWFPAAILLPVVPLALTWITCLASVSRTDWIKVAETLRNEVQDGDLVLSATSLGAPTFEYHLADRYRLMVVPSDRIFQVFRHKKEFCGPGWTYDARLMSRSIRFGAVISPLQAIEMAVVSLDRYPNSRVWLAWTEEPYGPPLFERFDACIQNQFAATKTWRFRGQFSSRLVCVEHSLNAPRDTSAWDACAITAEDARKFWTDAVYPAEKSPSDEVVSILRRTLPGPLPADVISLVGESLLLAALGYAEPARTLAESAMSRSPDGPEAAMALAMVEALTGGDEERVDALLRRVSVRSAFFGLYRPAVLARCRGDMEAFARETARLERMGIPWMF
ncbi:MAG: glycosyltransferase family 39 protein [Candidatus Hydrogenedentes bacterium]|nr:glycosyltransferase family 39 protein [Candidatus Hydrogenedentota bacterium]